MSDAVVARGAVAASPEPTRSEQPIILIRGWGGLGVSDEKKIAYQGFNDGTVYPHKRGENYIYEGMILRFMKWATWSYHDATNIVGYYGSAVERDKDSIRDELSGFDSSLFSGNKVVIDPAMALNLIRSKETDAYKTLWVFRYYDLDDRDDFKKYGEALVRLIDFIQQLAILKEDRKEDNKKRPPPKVNIIAHSMGGLIVREAVQRTYPKRGGEAVNHINKVVTLGTPHQGISFQILQDWIGIAAAEELERFNPEKQKTKTNPVGFENFAKHFPPERVLTVVGTNYRTYGPVSWLNRAFSLAGEFGPNYNRSDGLVKQTCAQLPGAPRTFVHKCHGGPDFLVTSREAFEIATRFFFGNIGVRLYLLKAEISRGGDWIGKSEFFFGVSIKPRRVDFDLFHQSVEAENCYGPFAKADLTDPSPAFNWAAVAGNRRLIWEGRLDARATETDDIVLRLDIYVGERDLYGIGFSDNVIFRKQYYVRAVFDDIKTLNLRELILHDSEHFADEERAADARRATGEERAARMDQPQAGDRTRWEFPIKGTGFTARFGIDLSIVPETG